MLNKSTVLLLISLSLFSCTNSPNIVSYSVINSENTKNYVIDIGNKSGASISAKLNYNNFNIKANTSGARAKNVNDVSTAMVYLLALPSGYNGTDPIGDASFVSGPVNLSSPGGFFKVTFINVGGQQTGIKYFIGIRLKDSLNNDLIKPNNGSNITWTGTTAQNSSFALSSDSVYISNLDYSVSNTTPLNIVANLNDAIGAHLETNISANSGSLSSPLLSAGILQGISVISGNTSGSNPSTSNQIATDIKLNSPSSVAVDSSGNVYIADTNNNYIEKIDTNGNLKIIAGKTAGSTPTTSNQIATNVLLNSPNSVAVDLSGNVYIADTNNNYIEKIDTNGNLKIIAGKTAGTAPTTSNQVATNVILNSPNSVAVDLSGNVYIADSGNNYIEKVDTNGNLKIIAGKTAGSAPTTANQVATTVLLNSPKGINTDSSGNVYIADTNNNYIEKVDTNGNLKIIAGKTAGSTPTTSNQIATNILLNSPKSIGIDSSGNIFIADSNNNYIEKIDTNGNLKIIAGNSSSVTPTINNQSSLFIKLNNPSGIALDSFGNIFIADKGSNYVERLFQ